MVPDAVPTPIEERPTNGDVPAVVSAVPTARRKFLTRSIAGGSVAALVAGKPVKTLAKAYCKFSGWNSVKVKKKKGKGVTLSNAPTKNKCTVTIEPAGYYYTTKKGQPVANSSAGHFPFGKTWAPGGIPSVTIVNTSNFLKNFTFNSLFGTGDGSTVLSILAGSSSIYSDMILIAFAQLNDEGGFPLTQTYIYKLWANYIANEYTLADLEAFVNQLI
jgi:hypothetical protein